MAETDNWRGCIVQGFAAPYISHPRQAVDDRIVSLRILLWLQLGNLCRKGSGSWAVVNQVTMGTIRSFFVTPYNRCLSRAIWRELCNAHSGLYFSFPCHGGKYSSRKRFCDEASPGKKISNPAKLLRHQSSKTIKFVVETVCGRIVNIVRFALIKFKFNFNMSPVSNRKAATAHNTRWFVAVVDWWFLVHSLTVTSPKTFSTLHTPRPQQCIQMGVYWPWNGRYLL